MTPNFGYLLGIYPLIKIIDNLKKKNPIIQYYDLITYGILGICIMHIVGIIYSCIQIVYFNQSDLLIYNISKYSFGKFGFHILMLTPLAFLIKLINKSYKSRK